MKAAQEQFTVANLLSNFSSIFMGSLEELISKLEVAGDHRSEVIHRWCRDAGDMVKFCVSVLRFCRNSNALHERFLVALESP